MKKLSLPFIEHNKLLLIVSLSVIILLLVGYYFFTLYQDVMSNKTTDFEEVKDFAMENTDLSVINSIERFHGDQLYYVLDGVTEEKEAYYVYVYQSEEDEWKFELHEQEPLYSEDVLLTEWQERCQNCKYLGSSIGLDQDIPILEIKYLDQAERLVYEHVLLNDKSQYRLTLTPSFQ